MDDMGWGRGREQDYSFPTAVWLMSRTSWVQLNPRHGQSRTVIFEKTGCLFFNILVSPTLNPSRSDKADELHQRRGEIRRVEQVDQHFLQALCSLLIGWVNSRVTYDIYLATRFGKVVCMIIWYFVVVFGFRAKVSKRLQLAPTHSTTIVKFYRISNKGEETNRLMKNWSAEYK